MLRFFLDSQTSMICFFKLSWSALENGKIELLDNTTGVEDDVSGLDEDANGGGLGELIFINDW